MRFDANRLAQLAGIGKSSTQTLSEAAEREGDEIGEEVKPLPKHLPSHPGKQGDAEDEDKDEGTVMERFLAELEQEEGHHMGEDDDTHEGEQLDELGNRRKRDEMGDTDEKGHQLAEGRDDEVLEIDENMLRREIMRMKGQRQETLAESKLRDAIRNEIDAMLSEGEIDEDIVYSDSTWMYGENRPRNSRKGQVTLGALGIGFK